MATHFCSWWHEYPFGTCPTCSLRQVPIFNLTTFLRGLSGKWKLYRVTKSAQVSILKLKFPKSVADQKLSSQLLLRWKLLIALQYIKIRLGHTINVFRVSRFFNRRFLTSIARSWEKYSAHEFILRDAFTLSSSATITLTN